MLEFSDHPFKYVCTLGVALVGITGDVHRPQVLSK
jgi:hypothetical protein